MPEVRPRRVTIVRYLLPDGSWGRKGQKGAVRKKVLSRHWYVYLDRKLVPLKTTDEQVAWERLRALLRERREKELGIHAPKDQEASRTVLEHLAGYVQVLRDRGTGPKQLRLVESRLRRLAAAAGWERPADLDEPSLLRALGALSLAAQTRNHYRTHVLSFAAYVGRRTGHNPLAGVAVPLAQVEADPRHPRRCPTDAEVRAVLARLGGKRTRNRLTGDQRRLLYLTAGATGLRAGELRTLTWESLDLSRGVLVVQAAYSKHRRKDVLPLPAWLVTQLRAHREAGGLLWSEMDEWHQARMLQADLAAAGVPYRTEAGFFDFHAWRVWYISELASQPGISPKVLMSLARHSDPRLTLAIYSKVRLADQQAAVDAIPDPTADESGPRRQARPR